METSKKIEEHIEETKQKWIYRKKGCFQKTNETEEQAEVKELVKNILTDLKELKQADTDRFESFYWETYVIVERDNIFDNSYSGIMTAIALVSAVVSAFFAASGELGGDNFYDKVILVCVAVMVIDAIVLTARYFHCLFSTRTRSYYHFLLAAAEEIKNMKEE